MTDAASMPPPPAVPTNGPTGSTPTAGTVGAWGGGAGVLGLATWAAMSLSGFQDDIRTAQAKMELRMQSIASDVKSMAKSVNALEHRSESYVTESRLRDYVKLRLLEFEHAQSLKDK